MLIDVGRPAHCEQLHSWASDPRAEYKHARISSWLSAPDSGYNVTGCWNPESDKTAVLYVAFVKLFSHSNREGN